MKKEKENKLVVSFFEIQHNGNVFCVDSKGLALFYDEQHDVNTYCITEIFENI